MTKLRINNCPEIKTTDDEIYSVIDQYFDLCSDNEYLPVSHSFLNKDKNIVWEDDVDFAIKDEETVIACSRKDALLAIARLLPLDSIDDNYPRLKTNVGTFTVEDNKVVLRVKLHDGKIKESKATLGQITEFIRTGIPMSELLSHFESCMMAFYVYKVMFNRAETI